MPFKCFSVLHLNGPFKGHLNGPITILIEGKKNPFTILIEGFFLAIQFPFNWNTTLDAEGYLVS